ncbi:hypothetical protein D915_006592 [Fasciola hepatica]|uniref:Secreted protein n=1 Tax=Fasciola hepatica TaxID=6192 RepID=A0A4E0RP65_FASHE|nr:hypothetical protein D915_006592 [Fasciola hepatica]
MRKRAIFEQFSLFLSLSLSWRLVRTRTITIILNKKMCQHHIVISSNVRYDHTSNLIRCNTGICSNFKLAVVVTRNQYFITHD